MYHRILVPVDGSDLSEGIIPYAAQIARAYGARVTLMYVAALEDAASGDPEVKIVPGDRTMPVRQYLDEMRQAMGRHGVGDVDFKTAGGSPPVEIIHFAEEQRYDLIAMATHGRSGLGRWMFGSTTDKVVHSSTLPLLLLRPQDPPRALQGEAPIHTAVIPLDGSPLAEMVLDPAVNLAQTLDLDVALLRVVPSVTMAYAGFEPYAYDPRIDEELETGAAEYVKHKAEELRSRQVHVSDHTRRGYPAVQIVDFAEEVGAGIIVMSTHGRTGVGRWVLGSVADRVLRSSNLPVLLMRSAEPEAEEGA